MNLVKTIHDGDHQATIDLINRDRVPGQPAVTPFMLAEALAKRSSVDSVSWGNIVDLRHVIVRVPGGAVVGAAAYGVDGDGNGTIPWIHAAEDEDVLNALLDTIEADLPEQANEGIITAFQHATALSIGLEGLPVQHRDVTHRVLGERGYVGEDLWLYMLKGSIASGAGGLDDYPLNNDLGLDFTVENIRDEAQVEGEETITLTATRGGRKVGEAKIGVEAEGTGVLWWIEVGGDERGKGYGAELWRQAENTLAAKGMNKVILFVDHDEPGSPDRSRVAAIGLYENNGFEAIDHLHSYSRGGEKKYGEES